MNRSAALMLLAVLLAALGVRLAAAWWWQARQPGRFVFGDSESYWELSRTIAQGGPYQFGSPDAKIFRTPAYPLVLAPLFLIAGREPPVIWARMLGVALGTLTVAGVAWLAWQLFDRRTALVAASIAAIEPGAVAMSVMVLSEALFCPLMVLHLGLWTAAWQSRRSGRMMWLGLGAGIAAGAATLARPSWLLFTPLVVLVGLVLTGQRKRHVQLGAAMLLGLALAMLPWWIRNYQAVGHFVPTTLQVGVSLYDGLSPQATGASDLGFVAQAIEEERKRPAAVNGVDEPLEYRVDQRLRRDAVAWAYEHPLRAIELTAIKFARMWNVWPNEGGLSSWPLRLAVLCTYVPLMILAAIGVARTVGCGWPYALCWLPAVYFTLLHVVFVASIRYRMPAMLMLIVLAAGVLTSLREEITTEGCNPLSGP